jgi:hypothetical protein
VEFQFDPTVCAITQTDDYFVIDVLGDSTVFDTIWINGEGSGGSVSNVQSTARGSMFNEMEIADCSDLFNLICIEMRKRNYELVHTKSMEFLNNYIDSTGSMEVLSKLYLTGLVLDSSGNKISGLKNFFETLILQNGENERLVKKLFYLIQKCKTALGEYESAMTGFQQIINQNPYGYEGLVASWDYAATSLLLSAQGSGGGISNYLPRGEADEFQVTSYEFTIVDDENIINNNKSKIINPKSNVPDDDPNDKYDSKKFKKEDRKVIRENVYKSFETSHTRESEWVKVLEIKVAEQKASENEKSELIEKKILKEIVKARKPSDIKEHIKIVNESISRIFNSAKANTGQKPETTLPAQYILSQNYPNPFNPVTTISYELPQDSKVKLVVYDLLGREIIKLVNDEFKTAGKYTVEFDARFSARQGSNLSSGVYFYRLEVSLSNPLQAVEFMNTKRMVLIK